MNKVILMGRLTRDPEVRYSQGERQMAIARYTLAVDRRGRNATAGEQTADFLPCIAFDKAAEFAEKYFHQGTKLIVTGRIQTGSYTNKDGQKVYTTDIIVEEQELRYSLSDDDLMQLAKLHKANLFRKKIEELLKDCTCHEECDLMSSGDYSKWL